MRFCGGCGKPLAEVCASCGFENPPAFKFCGQCASPLGAPPSVGAPPASMQPLSLRGDGAERRQITVLFCDVVGSTQLSDKLDPEELRDVIRAYQATSSDVIDRYEGHIAQYLGDGLLVYFGYPRAHEDAPRRAVKTALDIVRAIDALNSDLERRYGVTLALRIAIHTDYGVAGDVGGKGRKEQLVIGRTPNIAARLQELARPNTVVVSDATKQLAERWFAFESCGEHLLKGISRPMTVWRAVSENAHAERSRGLSPLVGRGAELETLATRFERSRDGHGQIVLLAGEPGLGKSRLLEAFEAHLGDGATVLNGWCSPYAQTTALHPLVAPFEQLLGFARGDDAARRGQQLASRLAKLELDSGEATALLASFFGLPRPSGSAGAALSPQKQLEHTLHLLVDLLVESARSRPVVLVLEDLHWSDPSTFQFLELLVAAAGTTRLLAMLTFRPVFEPPWAPRRHLTRIDLVRLRDDDARRILDQLTDGKPLPRDVERQLLERSDGVPLFLEEMTKAILESGLLVLRGERWELTRPMDAPVIPATLRDSLMARLDHFASVKEVAQLASAIGRQFSYEMLSALAGIPEPTLRAHLEQLVASELVFRVEEPGAAAEYRFKHALIQDTAYESMLKSRRRDVHERIAQVLEEQHPGVVEASPSLLARHWEGAGQGERAARYLHRAAQRAMERGAHSEAITDLGRAIGLLATAAPSTSRDRLELDLRVSLNGSLIPTRGYCAPELEENCLVARELCERLGRPNETAPVLYTLWVIPLALGRRAQTWARLEELLAFVREAPDRLSELSARFAHGTTLLYAGRLAEAREAFEGALALYEAGLHGALVRIHGDDHGVYALVYLGWAEVRAGRVAVAREHFARALALAEEFRDPLAEALALAIVGLAQHDLRDEEMALAHAERNIALSDAQGFFFWAALAHCTRGWVRVRRGDHAGGIGEIEQGLGFFDLIQQKLPLTYWMGYLVEACLETGDLDRGLATVDRALAMSAANSDSFNEPELLRLKGELLATRTPASDEALACCERAVEIARRDGAAFLALRAATSAARLLVARAEPARARELLAAALAAAPAAGDAPDAADARALLAETSELAPV